MKSGRILRVLTLAIMVSISLMLCSCGGTPSSAVKHQLKRYQNEKYCCKAIEESFTDESERASNDYSEDGKVNLEDYYRVVYKKSGLEKSLGKSLSDFSFKVTDEEIKDDKAEVTVLITSPNRGNIFETTVGNKLDEFYESVTDEMDSWTREDEMEVLGKAASIISKSLEDVRLMDCKDETKEVTVKVVKNNGEWQMSKLQYQDAKVIDAMSGGVFSRLYWMM